MIKPFRWVKWLIKSIFGVKEMITLPTGLNEFMKGQNLDGLKPFALLYRNKWDSVNNKYALEDTPIDISAPVRPAINCIHAFRGVGRCTDARR